MDFCKNCLGDRAVPKTINEDRWYVRTTVFTGPLTWASLTKGNIMASSPYDALDGEAPQLLLDKFVPSCDLYRYSEYSACMEAEVWKGCHGVGSATGMEAINVA